VTIPLPRLSAPELRRKLLRLGFLEDRQKSSHLILRHRDDPSRYAVVSIHSRKKVPDTFWGRNWLISQGSVLDSSGAGA
jgi:predicted RNA binding protein YcfA (HicA-like mRNA interferase family)